MNETANLWKKIQTPLIWTLSAGLVGIFLTFITTINSELSELRSIDSNMERILLERNAQRLKEIEEIKTTMAKLMERANQLSQRMTRMNDKQAQMETDLAERWGQLRNMISDVARTDQRLIQLEDLFRDVQASGVIGRMDALEAIVNKLTRSLLIRDPDKRYPYYVNPQP